MCSLAFQIYHTFCLLLVRIFIKHLSDMILLYHEHFYV